MPTEMEIIVAAFSLFIGFLIATIVWVIIEDAYWYEVRDEMGDHICGEDVIFSEFLNYSNTDNIVNCIQRHPKSNITHYHSVSVGGVPG